MKKDKLGDCKCIPTKDRNVLIDAINTVINYYQVDIPRKIEKGDLGFGELKLLNLELGLRGKRLMDAKFIEERVKDTPICEEFKSQFTDITEQCTKFSRRENRALNSILSTAFIAAKNDTDRHIFRNMRQKIGEMSPDIEIIID